jgi:hypothetical protein
MDYAMDEDRALRDGLASLEPRALMALRSLLGETHESRRDLLKALLAKPAHADLAQLIALADTDETVRLRLLRAIRDIDHSSSPSGKRRS